MTLRQIASLIRNNVVSGLKGVTNESFSMEQLMHEVMLETNTIITKHIKERSLLVSNISQRLDGIEMKCEDTSSNCSIGSQTYAKHVKIPKLAQFVTVEEALSYVGPMDNSFNFKVYINEDYMYHQYNLVTKNKPYAWLNTSDDEDGMYDIYFFNLGKYDNLKFISVVARFENPTKLLSSEFGTRFKASEFYAPDIILNEVIQNITKRWIELYKLGATPPIPNTQE